MVTGANLKPNTMPKRKRACSKFAQRLTGTEWLTARQEAEENESIMLDLMKRLLPEEGTTNRKPHHVAELLRQYADELDNSYPVMDTVKSDLYLLCNEL